MKAIIPCGGKGTRLRPITHTTAKPLVPVANKPILFYILEQVVEAGINEIGIIISPEYEACFKETVGAGEKWGAKISYIMQAEQRGLADTVIQSQKFLGDSPFLMFLGDNLVQDGVKGIIAEFKESGADAIIQLKSVTDPTRFGVAVLDQHKRVIKLVEKPKEPPSDLAIAGIYLFQPIIHRAVKNITPSQRGELEITDAIQMLIDMNCCVKARMLEGWWLDTGKKEDMLEANRIILTEQASYQIQGEVDGDSVIYGQVELGSGSKVMKSVIRGPVRIGNNVSIANSFIGPYSAIGNGCKIEDVSLQYSVALDNCQLKNIDGITDSLIGFNCKLERSNRAKGLTLLLGDNSELTI